MTGPRDEATRAMRIVFGATGPEWGGNEKWAIASSSGLAARGHDVTVLWSRGPVGRELAKRGLRGRRALFVNGWNPLGLVSLICCLLFARPDVVVLTRRHEYLAGGIAARVTERLVSLTRRVSGMTRRPARVAIALRLGLRRRLRDDYAQRKAFGELADLVVVNSRAISEGLRESRWLDHDIVHVLLNGVEETSVSAFAGRSALNGLGVAAGSPVLVAAGRLNRQKGFDVLIDAMAIVRQEAPDVVLVILGEGRRRRSLEDRAERLGVEDGVIFAGQRTDVREIMAAADVYVLSSRNEGMANTLLEAMSVGAPIVATDVAGTQEAVRDGVDALIVPPGDANALSGAVLRLVGDRELAARLASSALDRARKLFGVDRMVGELEAMLLDTISRSD
jgi:glycosyltransferase involved in cell wall biosynthesis